jgi:hypothetical protein
MLFQSAFLKSEIKIGLVKSQNIYLCTRRVPRRDIKMNYLHTETDTASLVNRADLYKVLE